MYALGIDVDGTFTDVVIIDQQDEVGMLKIPSTPENPLEGIKNGLKELADLKGCSQEELVMATERFVHGTTVATQDRRGKGGSLQRNTSVGQ